MSVVDLCKIIYMDLSIICFFINRCNKKVLNYYFYIKRWKDRFG